MSKIDKTVAGSNNGGMKVITTNLTVNTTDLTYANEKLPREDDIYPSNVKRVVVKWDSKRNLEMQSHPVFSSTFTTIRRNFNELYVEVFKESMEWEEF